MRNSKGFTLIELIVVIALLGIISVVVGLNITNMMDKQDDKQITEYKKKLEDAACVYAEINDITSNKSVEFDKLIQAGLIRNDLVNPAATNKEKNKVTDDTSHIIKITFSDNIKKCTYSNK